MITRQNWLDVNSYLEYHQHILLRSEKTIRRKRSLLRHLLEWADEVPFPLAHAIRPVFPQYLLTARNDGKDVPLAPIGMKRICNEARQFYQWMLIDKTDTYESVSVRWIETLRPARSHGVHSVHRELKTTPCEDVIALSNLKPKRLIDQRDQAAAAFLFLSGMRIDAFVSLPIKCVDLTNMCVEQFPEDGVRTKNRKAARTYLYQIPELTTVVQAWDRRVRAAVSWESPWYAYMRSDGMRFSGKVGVTKYRRRDFVRGLKRLCPQAGIEYRSPHAFRHGHGVYGVKHSNTMEELKAVSQNMMHATLTTTDSMYGNLNGEDVRKVITNLGQEEHALDISPNGLQLAQVLKILLEKPELLDRILESLLD